MEKKTIVFGCDNAAVELKKTLMEFVSGLGYQVEDVGVPDKDDGTYYPLVAKEACQRILNSNGSMEGILLCGTGIGMCITANKFPNIRAAVCHDVYSAERAKLSNNSNVMCMGARVVGSELAKELARTWLSLQFVDGSSTPKVQAIADVEKELHRPA